MSDLSTLISFKNETKLRSINDYIIGKDTYDFLKNRIPNPSYNKELIKIVNLENFYYETYCTAKLLFIKDTLVSIKILLPFSSSSVNKIFLYLNNNYIENQNYDTYQWYNRYIIIDYRINSNYQSDIVFVDKKYISVIDSLDIY